MRRSIREHSARYAHRTRFGGDSRAVIQLSPFPGRNNRTQRQGIDCSHYAHNNVGAGEGGLLTRETLGFCCDVLEILCHEFPVTRARNRPNTAVKIFEIREVDSDSPEKYISRIVPVASGFRVNPLV